MSQPLQAESLIINFQRILREIREERGATIYRIATDAGISWRMLKQIEKGERRPSLEVFCKICLGMGLKPSELLSKIENAST